MSEQKIMLIFPGQGAQSVGIGSDIYTEFACARETFDRASEVLGYDLADICFRNPEDKLNLTEFTQPALLTHAIACERVLEELTEGRVKPEVVAGHSLGEYSALVTAKALSFDEALKLVQRRGQLFQEHGRGKMIAVARDADFVLPYTEQFYCEISGYNLPNQTIVGGAEKDLARLVEKMERDLGGRLTKLLNTKGAFHTYLMVKAAEGLREVLDSTDITEPNIRVISNYTGDYHTAHPNEIRGKLFSQVYKPVKWLQGMERALHDGVDIVVELGGGVGNENPKYKKPNLAGITGRIIRGHNRSTDRPTIYRGGINTQSLREVAKAII